MSNIQVGGKIARNGRFRIERPFVGVIAGLSVNRLRPLDLAAERDPHVTVRGDVQLVTGVLDRNDLQRMQQVRNFKPNKNLHKFFFFYFHSYARVQCRNIQRTYSFWNIFIFSSNISLEFSLASNIYFNLFLKLCFISHFPYFDIKNRFI